LVDTKGIVVPPGEYYTGFFQGMPRMTPFQVWFIENEMKKTYNGNVQ
jgi:hypothetical protein